MLHPLLRKKYCGKKINHFYFSLIKTVMQKEIAYKNKIVAYRVEGEGEVVLLLHGFGEDSHIWDGQINFLKSSCRVITLDLPGSGASEYNDQLSSLNDFADCINALLMHENISQSIMLGHSMGGYILLSFAEKYPQLLKAFGLVHSTAFADSEEKKLVRTKGIEAIEQYGAYAFLKNTIPNLFGGSYKKEQSAKVDELIEQGKQFPKKALQQYYTAMMNRPDKTSVLQNSEVPVLFVIGTADVAAPLTDVLKQAHLPEIAYIHILENTGHIGMWEARDLVNKYLLEFISDID